MKAHQALSLISADDELWYAQFRQEKAERDYISGLRSAERKGEREGLARGRAEGRAEGEREGLARGRAEGERKKALEIALALRQSGIDDAFIAKSTGLSPEEIAGLQP